jgi:predicted enzyme related to lactoylglutathione lyase
MPKIVHFEIPADDPQRAGAFYRHMLGWEISPSTGAVLASAGG